MAFFFLHNYMGTIEPYRSKGIQIIGFESKISQVHKRGVA